MTTPLRRFTSVVDRIDALTRTITLLIAVFVGVVIVLLDIWTGAEISFSIFYVAPISIIAWKFGRVAGLMASALGAFAWYLAERVGDRIYTDSLVPVWNGIARLVFFAIITVLLVALRRLLDEQTADARVDALTGLLNRRGFLERMDVEIARARRSRQPLTIAYFDVDGFKRINDTAGHSAGDEVLSAVGTTTRTLVRDVDAVGRMGGDEFVVLLPETSAAAAPTIVERLRAALREVGERNDIGFSIGVVTFDPAPTDADAAVRRADDVMYAVKLHAKGTVRYESEPASA